MGPTWSNAITGRPMIRFLVRCPRTGRTTARTCIGPVRTPVSNGLLGAFLPIKRLHQHEARANLEKNGAKGPLIDSRSQGLLQRTQITCHMPQLRTPVWLRGVLAEPWFSTTPAKGSESPTPPLIARPGAG